MKAITLTQPWATLIAIGAKRIETRSWRTFYRGPLAIHAAKTFPEWAREHFEFDPALDQRVCEVLEAADIHGFRDLPGGAVVATCTLVDCVRITPDNVPAAPEFYFGDYTVGRWAWHLSEVKALDMPVLARGSLGLWEWPGEREGDKDALSPRESPKLFPDAR